MLLAIVNGKSFAHDNSGCYNIFEIIQQFIKYFSNDLNL